MINFKNIIFSRNMKIKVMQKLSFLPDDMVVKLQYRIKTHKKLHLKNPKRYTEKLQWYKLNYKNPIMRECVDKYSVREYVEKQGLGSLLNKCYGIYNSPDEVEFDLLPNKFVCKDTLGGGSNSVILVDKKNIDFEYLKQTMNKWVNEPVNKKHPGREWPYDNRKHRIIIEEYLEQNDGDLADYKFFCFNGKVEYFYIRTDYVKNHENGKMAFFDKNLNLMPDVGLNYCSNANGEKIKLFSNINEMIKYAEILSKEFPHVRVDFYNVDGRIIFGELTFYNASGYMSFTPDDFDFIMGSKFIIQATRKDKICLK